MDVILENHRLLRKLKIKLVPTHVYRHRDRVKTPNEFMDNLVSEFLLQPPDDLNPQEEALFFPAQQVCLKCDGITITSELEEKLVLNEKQVIIQHYFEKHFQILP